jgi:uncharacterized protein
MLHRMLAVLLIGLGPAMADEAAVVRALDRVILPGFAQLQQSTADLAAAARADCRAESPALQQAYGAAFDAWVAVETYRAGPLEDQGNALAIAFWPDLKGAMPRALTGLLAQPEAPSAAEFAQVSVAARGLFALEAMLFDPDFNTYAPESTGCQLVQVMAVDLATTAAQVTAAWEGDYAPLMRSAGVAGNTRFLSSDEVTQQMYTAALAELEFISDTRIGRPLGDDRARPNRAEARASARSQRNVGLSVQAVRDLVAALADQTDSAGDGDMFAKLDYALYANGQIKDPAFADVDTTGGHFRLQEVWNAVRLARSVVVSDLGARLGVTQGFNALDGD